MLEITGQDLVVTGVDKWTFWTIDYISRLFVLNHRLHLPAWFWTIDYIFCLCAESVAAGKKRIKDAELQDLFVVSEDFLKECEEMKTAPGSLRPLLTKHSLAKWGSEVGVLASVSRRERYLRFYAALCCSKMRTSGSGLKALLPL